MCAYIDVILPLPLESFFTYYVKKEEAQALFIGSRVAVPFGKNKIYTALVVKKHNVPPRIYQAKPIYSLLDETALVTESQLRFWEWISQYYMCPLGEVYRAAIPSGYLLQSETYLTKTAKLPKDLTELNDESYLVVEALEKQEYIKINDIKNLLGKKNILSLIQKMIQEGWVETYENIREKYTPLKVTFVKLVHPVSSKEDFDLLLKKISRSPKQYDLLMGFLSVSPQHKDISKKTLLNHTKSNASILKSLVKKGIFEEYSLELERSLIKNQSDFKDVSLSPAQNRCLVEIKNGFQTHPVVLLNGITSSGKTEVYKKVIESYINQEKQVLYLLPEIVLTAQIIKKLQSYFGEKLIIYHSKYNSNEQVEIWDKVLKNKPQARIILGTRSAIWLPFHNLGLIIIDEEHETSYKQQNPAPRFNSRESAIVLAKQVGAKVLLGSATPSLESYYNSSLSKYKLVELSERYHKDTPSVDIKVIDLKDCHKRKQMTSCFSDELLEAIENTVARNEQVILYQNRRGYAPFVECHSCGHAPQCDNCDVTLNYHKTQEKLICHYCGYQIKALKNCMVCGSPDINYKGYGTEQIEAALNQIKPHISTQRLDLDTTRGKHSYDRIISKFERQEIQVLIGTQMVAKGLDFKNSSLIGVINADNLFHFQDFRAHERAFQTLKQLIGRVGRVGKAGTAIIQSYNPNHRIIKQLLSDDYQGFYKHEISHRESFNYPPYYRLIKITFKHPNYQRVDTGANWFKKALDIDFDMPILGPQSPFIGRIKNQYLKTILIKIPTKASQSRAKKSLNKIVTSFTLVSQFRSINISLDIDCY